MFNIAMGISMWQMKLLGRPCDWPQINGVSKLRLKVWSYSSQATGSHSLSFKPCASPHVISQRTYITVLDSLLLVVCMLVT